MIGGDGIKTTSAERPDLASRAEAARRRLQQAASLADVAQLPRQRTDPPLKLLVSEQHLGHADVDLLLEKVRGEAVPERGLEHETSSR